jgi:hypothetical protein
LILQVARFPIVKVAVLGDHASIMEVFVSWFIGIAVISAIGFLTVLELRKRYGHR